MRGVYDVGYTAGVFDVLHIEHLEQLQVARELCDFLLVGVPTDELVLEVTGTPPTNPYDERIEVVRSLRPVDAVVGQLTTDVGAVWHQLRFTRLLPGAGEPLLDPASVQALPPAVDVAELKYRQRSRSALIRAREDPST